MTARFIVGDTRAVTATLPDGSVELCMCSPPYLALRSYLPADHSSKALEIGSEATPAEFIDVLLALTAEWRRVLNPRTGSIVIELGDTYAGSGGAGGDYQQGGWRAGQPGAAGSMKTERKHKVDGWGPFRDEWDGRVQGGGPGWPRNKSATLIPESYRWALAYGYNPFTGAESPAGRWQIRNTITRCSPNPPVGALGKKWRPATTNLVVATPDDDRRYWDDVATRVAHKRDYSREADATAKRLDRHNAVRAEVGLSSSSPSDAEVNPAGAPLLDWWQIVAGGYPGAHYAVYPPELCEPFIEAMCPRRVCRTCGEPSRREVDGDRTYDPDRQAPYDAALVKQGQRVGFGTRTTGCQTTYTTTGWTTCGHPGTDGLQLDGYHTGTGWRPGIVLDPFAGTFTTGAVATGHGRDAIGIDLDERNAQLALERVGPLLLSVEHHDTTTAA